jgi:hypothetical protein
VHAAYRVFSGCVQVEAGVEEFWDYIFPEEQVGPSLKILEMAHKWKRQKQARNLTGYLLLPSSPLSSLLRGPFCVFFFGTSHVQQQQQAVEQMVEAAAAGSAE